ncbi:MAG TPA: SpoIID/LytB domain-containing protein [Bacteroidales bacterium]|jgi:stage II sporulation protein D|nr:SpoIID/LytB domain-containing protein [Bacteroidales bacterium]
MQAGWVTFRPEKIIMTRKLIIFIYFLTAGLIQTPGQVRIRIFADQHASSAVFSVATGKYEIDVYDGKPVSLFSGDPVILAFYKDKIAVKIRDSRSFLCDSLTVKGLTGNDLFYFRVNGAGQIRKAYSGDLHCHPDLGILVFINLSDIEKYIAGVVRTEGGTGRNIEYLKTQAVLARTFLYRHMERHIIDRYHLCDNTHCQAFNGITSDPLITRAALETKGMVAIHTDSTLIISAFHSNCGGETSTSDYVWLSGHDHIQKVIDPYCTSSPNATWRKTIPLSEWTGYLRKSGYNPGQGGPVSYSFPQLTRQSDYKIGSFSLSFNRIRNDLNLKSAFFSVQQDGNQIVLRGRGYGHGVGLCQEGAMVMASRGFKFTEIIRFYYPDASVADIRYAKIVKNDF